jgi:hypothetical protein
MKREAQHISINVGRHQQCYGYQYFLASMLTSPIYCIHEKLDDMNTSHRTLPSDCRDISEKELEMYPEESQ